MRTLNETTFSFAELKSKVTAQQMIQQQTPDIILKQFFENVEVAAEHQAFIPIAYKAVERLLKYTEPLRLKRIQWNCLGAIEEELQTPWRLDKDNHPEDESDVAGFVFDFEMDDEGEVTQTRWYDPTDDCSRIDGRLYDIERLKLDNAIEAANNSYAFQALKLKLSLINSAVLVASTWGEQ